MVERMWPGGVQPETAAPIVIPLHAGDYGSKAVTGGTYNEPLHVQLHCPTQGSSIAYTVEAETGEAAASWRLYTGPIRLPQGTTALRAKAIRIGYKESGVSSAEFTVTR
jgi:hypothetical protein